MTSYLDRNALSNARVQGIEEDLGLKGSQFNTAISVSRRQLCYTS